MSEPRIDALEVKVAEHGLKIERLENSMHTLRADVSEIKSTLASLATKSDLSNAVNGLLREALAAVPLKMSVVWSALSALAAAATVAVALHH